MLLLVDADRNYVGLIKQDIRCHKNGVGEKSCVYVVCVLCALVLELSHSRELAEHSEAVEDPSKLGVLVNVRLNVESVLLGIKSASHIERERLVGPAAKLCGDLTHGYRVLVDYAVKALILFGVGREILDRSEVISYSEISAGLNARVGDLFILKHIDSPPWD